SAELISALETEGATFRVDPGSGVVLVPSERVSALRLAVAGAGVSRDNGYGYESLDQEQGLGTSQFMEMNRYRRSQEGELQRTIASMRNVQSARVHLATPERSVFMRTERQPSASVMLNLRSGRQLTETQVQAITSLVASSVPDMVADSVTVVDQNGNLLSGRDRDPEMVIAAEQFEYVRRFEDTLMERISRILHPVVGPGRFTAEVNASVDFTRIERAEEQFNPDRSALRSEQSLRESGEGLDAGGIPGALSNQPPGDAEVVAQETAVDEAADEDEPATVGRSREQSTRNYELDRTISYTNFDPVNLERITVAVVLDERSGEGATAWNEQELEQIRSLVRDAIGFDEQRGDRVTVLNQQFASVEVGTEEALPWWQDSWVNSTVRQLAAGLFVLALVFGVLLPVLRRLASGGRDGRSLTERSEAGEFADLDLESGSDPSVTLSGGDDVLLPGPEEGYERQLNAVRSLVADDPARVAQVVKQWIDRN
ncbi:MAG: flagellar basal-body MS-ring/collar protein FliF, partial [Pseudomonadota bacterium]